MQVSTDLSRCGNGRLTPGRARHAGVSSVSTPSSHYFTADPGEGLHQVITVFL